MKDGKIKFFVLSLYMCVRIMRPIFRLLWFENKIKNKKKKAMAQWKHDRQRA